ncbi:MAG: hypothetical protein LBR66_09130 [Candidatus Symbiothrix sp.]|jgi:hypothetical protein|nr:hypothetical protein [Candidatus Symbiothrix sp.]
MKKITILFSAICLSFASYAQTAIFKATMDSAQILIGEQTALHLELAANKDSRVQLPFITDTLTAGIEVLNISQPDTTDIGNGRVQYNYDYLITSFDSALYLLPPFVAIIDADTVYSNDLALKVSTLPADVESGNFYDIKDVMKPEFVWTDYLIPTGIALLIYLLIVLAVYIAIRIINKKPIIPLKKETEIYLPPHVRALQSLDNIKEEHLWQHGKEKEYHSRLTDTIRQYIDERFGIDAPEMTSNQTLQALQGIADAKDVYAHLKQMLLLADFVKFAKYQPLPEENESSMNNAYQFVSNTIPAPPSEDQASEEENTNPIAPIEK